MRLRFGLFGIMEMMIDNIEKDYNIMENLSEGLCNMVKAQTCYKESYNKDGISFDLHGEGVIRNLKFQNGTSPSMIESAINGALERSRSYFENTYLNSLPLDARQVSLSFKQVIQQTALDMLQSKKP